MQTIETVYLHWENPLLPAITQRLLAGNHEGLTDLSGTMVVVPTAQAGRRLREALALSCRGLFPPDIVTPDGFLELATRVGEIADDADMVAAWISVFRALDYAQFNKLFPIVPEQTIEWQISLAHRFIRLRNELGEAGLDFSQVARLNVNVEHEPERWQQLARLEGLYLDQLDECGLLDPKGVRRRAAQNYSVPKHIARIILAATPDPQPLIIQAFECAARQVPFEVWVYGPEDAHFDRWGCPITEHWRRRPLEFETWGACLHAVNTPKTASAFVVESMRETEPESTVLGLVDPRLNPIVASALSRANISTYDLEGCALYTSGVGQLAELLCQWYEDVDIALVRTLLQHPDIQAWLDLSQNAEQLLRHLDRLFETHLAPNLTALVRFAAQASGMSDLHGALVRLKQLAEAFTRADSFADALADALQKIYVKKQVSSFTETGASWKERAEAVGKKINLVAKAERIFPKLSKDFARQTLRQSLRDSRIYPIRPRKAHDLLGWLELLWNDAPHLILVGLNEHCVPESITGDAFLPEALRKQLGLRCNDQRIARDAYLLEAFCRRRAGQRGCIDILVPRYAQDQQPLKPSRLLFQGTSEALLRRSRQLFLTVTADYVAQESSFRSAWKLKPPPGLALPNELSVSALKDYLHCPFRFFLRHILKMRPVDVETRELSPAAFGTLFHDTVGHLKGLILDPSTRPADLIKKLHAIAGQLFKRRYGEHLSFALRLQHEALMARIIAFAEHQVDEIEKNGKTQILNTEEVFESSLDGMVLKGRIDRVDRRAGCLELIDYKTSNQPISPEKAHLKSIGKKAPPEHLPEEALFEHDGKLYCWTDLQLPLYGIIKQQDQKETISLAYFNLAQTSEKSGIARWEGFTADHLNSARACAEAVIGQIKAGIFWPPNSAVDESYDDFANLFPDGIENSVDATALMSYRFGTRSH